MLKAAKGAFRVIGMPTAVGEYRIAPYVSARVNNAPCAMAEPGAYVREVQRVIARLHVLTHWTRTSRDRLCSLLYEAAKGAPGDLVNSVLLPLKRDIYNCRATRVRAEEVARVVDDPDIIRWLVVQGEREDLVRELDGLHVQQCEDDRVALQRTCLDPRFQQSLTLSSGSVYHAAVAYARTPLASHKSKLRRSELRLLQYATRAATRTSPFSLYTSVAAGSWSESGAHSYPLRLGARRASSVVADHALVRRFLDAVVRHETVAPQVACRLAPNVRVLGDRVAYDTYVDDAERQPRVFLGGERSASMRSTTALRALVEWMRKSPGAVPRMAIASRILQLVPAASRAEAERFISELLVAGLLVPHVAIPEQCDRILDHAARFLDALALPLCCRLAALVRSVEITLSGFDTALASDRAARLTRAEGLWREAFEAIDARPPVSVLVYEDSVVSTPLDLHPSPWKAIVEDLRYVMPALEVFDFKIHLKTLVRDEFVRHYGPRGRCTDLGEFAQLLPKVYERVFNTWLRGPSESSEREDPCLATVGDLRRRLVDAFVTSAVAGEDEMALHAGLIDDIASRLPAQIRRDWTSYSAFVQPSVVRGTIVEAVINTVYGGLGAFLSRFAGIIDPQQTATLRQRIREFFPADHSVAEFRPVHGFNANLHPLLAPEDLGDVFAVEGNGILESDLAIEHDPTADAIVVTHSSTGKRLDVLYVGVLMPYLLPMKYGALYALGGSGQLNIAFHDAAEQKLDAGARERVRPYPRVRFGSLVLCRRRWYAVKSSVPVQEAGESDVAYFVRLNHWRLDAGIPATVFVRDKVSDFGQPQAIDRTEWRRRLSWTRSKPQFIDFRRGLFARYLSKWLQRDPKHDVFFEEVLPEFPHAAVREPGGSHIAEMVIELDRPADDWTC